MDKVRQIALLFFVALGTFAGACTHINGSEQSSSAGAGESVITLAIMPFHGVSEARNSGMIVADILANQLYALGHYDVLAPEVVLTRLAERDSETMSPAEIGALLQAPYIVAGRVTEYTYKTGVGETPAVGVTARLLEAATAKVVWSATRAGVGGGNWLREDSLSDLTGQICKELADSLNVSLRNGPFSPGADKPQTASLGSGLPGQ